MKRALRLRLIIIGVAAVLVVISFALLVKILIANREVEAQRAYVANMKLADRAFHRKQFFPWPRIA